MPCHRNDLRSLTDLIHHAALGAVPWVAVLEPITELFCANSAALHSEAKHGGGWGYVIGGDDRARSDYFEYYAGVHPLVAPTFSAPAGSILTDRMMMDRTEYERTEFFNDWARPNHFDKLVQLRLTTNETEFLAVGITRARDAREFGDSDIDLLRWLAPHLLRAAETYQVVSKIQMVGRLLADALDCSRRGVFGLDAAGRIIFANRAAQSHLAANDALRVKGGMLVANRPDLTAALRRLVRCVTVGLAPTVLALPRSDGRSPLLLQNVPSGRSIDLIGLRPSPAVLLLVDDPEVNTAPTAESLSAIYGLTATEAAVAVQVGRGNGLAAAAKALGIAPSTAKSHLKQVFGKTGTRRQAELTLKINRLSG